ncbi:unnamed protein product [Colias eurytheme]|nr:unnamed protein product [Colias eurytheme]
MASNTNELNQDLDNLLVSNAMICDSDRVCDIVKMETCKLTILTQNIRSISKNLPQFEIFLEQINLDIDIIILTECWLKQLPSIPSLSGYNSYATKYCPSQNDGVVVYLRTTLTGAAVTESTLHDANSLVVKLNNGTAIIAIYRSPATRLIDKFLESLNNLLSSLTSFGTIVVIGDININIAQTSADPRMEDYLNTMAIHGLLPAHRFSTRGNSSLDHVLLKSHLPCNTVVINSSVTDHAAVLLWMEKLKINKTKAITVTKINYDNVSDQIKSENFNDILQLTDVNLASEALIRYLQNVIQSNVIYKVITRNFVPRKPWITPGLLRCIRTRDRMHLKLKKQPGNQSLQIIYCRYRNFCGNILKKVKHAYEKAELSKCKKNDKQTWKLIKEFTNMTSSKTDNLELLRHNQTIDDINNFFVNIGKNMAENITKDVNSNDPNYTHSDQTPRDSMGLRNTDTYELSDIINNLKTECATGYDNIPAKIFKLCKDSLLPVLVHICNLSLQSGVFPESFKIALIHPIHKAGDLDKINNYRPISVLSTMSKILEKIIHFRLSTFLNKINFFSNNQYGFLKGKSTNDAVNNLTGHITEHLDRKKSCIGIFLDLAKAFDTVSIPILLMKLERAGVRGLPLQLLKSYLTDRKQVVKIGNTISSECTIIYGVPQGSVLGPTLFLVYINDLCNLSLSNGHVVSFADDTALVFCGSNWMKTKQSAEAGLCKVMTWLNENVLTLNLDKTKFMTFSLYKSTQPKDLTITAHTSVVKKYSGTVQACFKFQRFSLRLPEVKT